MSAPSGVEVHVRPALSSASRSDLYSLDCEQCVLFSFVNDIRHSRAYVFTGLEREFVRGAISIKV